MRVLVDTHAFFWWTVDDPKLSRTAREIIADPDNEVIVSAVTAWELATKARVGKWPGAADLVHQIETVLASNGFLPLPVTIDHARKAGFLVGRHRDPFDRMLAAQAQAENIPILTVDPVFELLGARAHW